MKELANWLAPLVGALVSAVSEAVAVAERLVREASLVEVRVCELNVVLRETGTPVPMEASEVIEVMDEFSEEDVRVDVPEKDMLDEPAPPMTAKGPE